MPGGRPTDYNVEMLEQANEYIESCVDTEKDVNLPTVEGLALVLGVSRKTIYNWGKVNPEFLHTLGIIEQKQKQKLISKGLSGDYNSTIAKLMLASNHGMSDRTDVTSAGKELKSLTKDDVVNSVKNLSNLSK